MIGRDEGRYQPLLKPVLDLEQSRAGGVGCGVAVPVPAQSSALSRMAAISPETIRGQDWARRGTATVLQDQYAHRIKIIEVPLSAQEIKGPEKIKKISDTLFHTSTP